MPNYEFLSFSIFIFKKGKKKKGNPLEVSRMQRRLQRRSMEKRRGAVSHPSAAASAWMNVVPRTTKGAWRRGRPYLLAPKAWYVTWLPRRKRQKWVLVILRKRNNIIDFCDVQEIIELIKSKSMWLHGMVHT